MVRDKIPYMQSRLAHTTDSLHSALREAHWRQPAQVFCSSDKSDKRQLRSSASRLTSARKASNWLCRAVKTNNVSHHFHNTASLTEIPCTTFHTASEHFNEINNYFNININNVSDDSAVIMPTAIQKFNWLTWWIQNQCPQTKPTNLGCKSACRLLLLTSTFAPFIIITKPKIWYSLD